MRPLAVCAALLISTVWAQNPTYTPDPNWTVPPEAAAKQNPLASKSGTAAGGRKLFMRHCAECHGTEGGGMRQKHSADLQLREVQSQSDGALFWKITNGNLSRGMPSFSRLPELQRWQIVLFIRMLKVSEK